MSERTNARDTQFQGFAHALLLQLAKENALALNWDSFFGELELTVARRAYDLVESAVWHALSFDHHESTGKEIIESVPDMPELPDDDKRYAEMQGEQE